MLHFIEIPNHANYLISKDGEVYSCKSKKRLKANLSSSSGYYTVYVDGKNRLLHRLLAQTFIPNPYNLRCINHKDGNKLNNDVNNLEWCDYSYNNKHAYKIGLKKYSFTNGENSANHKLTKRDVEFIKDNYKPYDGVYGAKALGEKFNVTPSCISSVARGTNWRNL